LNAAGPFARGDLECGWTLHAATHGRQFTAAGYQPLVPSAPCLGTDDKGLLVGTDSRDPEKGALMTEVLLGAWCPLLGH